MRKAANVSIFNNVELTLTVGEVRSGLQLVCLSGCTRMLWVSSKVGANRYKYT